MRRLLLVLEPIIWALFSAGMMVGGLLLPAWALVMGVAGPLGIASGATSYYQFFALASHPLARLVLLAAMALPLWGGAHHLRHLWLDFGGLRSDGLVGTLCYGGALVGSLVAIAAVARL
jgi:fumarate reductase subunit D